MTPGLYPHGANPAALRSGAARACAMSWHVEGSHDWYDLIVTTPRRTRTSSATYQGHIETGRPSLSDPALGPPAGLVRRQHTREAAAGTPSLNCPGYRPVVTLRHSRARAAHRGSTRRPRASSAPLPSTPGTRCAQRGQHRLISREGAVEHRAVEQLALVMHLDRVAWPLARDRRGRHAPPCTATPIRQGDHPRRLGVGGEKGGGLGEVGGGGVGRRRGHGDGCRRSSLVNRGGQNAEPAANKQSGGSGERDEKTSQGGTPDGEAR